LGLTCCVPPGIEVSSIKMKHNNMVGTDPIPTGLPPLRLLDKAVVAVAVAAAVAVVVAVVVVVVL
jgi:hypothetical protein